MDHIPLAQLDARKGTARRFRFDAGRHDRTHRPVFDDELNNDADVTHQFGGQDLDAGLDQLLTNGERVRTRA